jgi:hypothetical protein
MSAIIVDKNRDFLRELYFCHSSEIAKAKFVMRIKKRFRGLNFCYSDRARLPDLLARASSSTTSPLSPALVCRSRRAVGYQGEALRLAAAGGADDLGRHAGDRHIARRVLQHDRARRDAQAGADLDISEPGITLFETRKKT